MEWPTILSLVVSTVAAVATVAAAWIALRALKVQTEPDVIVYLKPHKQSSRNVNLIISNNGAAPAYAVSLRIDDLAVPHSSLVGKHLASLPQYEISMLAPGEHGEIYMGTFKELSDCWGQEDRYIRVSYLKKPGKDKHCLTFPVDTRSFMATIDISTATQEDRDRKKAFRDISRLSRSVEGISASLRSMGEAR